MVVCDCGSTHVNEKLEMFASCEDGIVSSLSELFLVQYSLFVAEIKFEFW